MLMERKIYSLKIAGVVSSIIGIIAIILCYVAGYSPMVNLFTTINDKNYKEIRSLRRFASFESYIKFYDFLFENKFKPLRHFFEVILPNKYLVLTKLLLLIIC